MKQAALITGAGQRIGRAVALNLAARGYQIALHYNRSSEGAEKTADEIRGRVECCLFQSDFNDPDESLGLITKVHSRFPDLSLLVNNASVFERASLRDTPPDLFDRVFRINLRTPFFLIRDFARICGKGQVINLLDTKITGRLVSYFAYSLFKKNLADLTEMAAKELGPDIRVNGIAPGLILPSAGDTHAHFEEMGNRIPMRQAGNPGAILSALAYLLDNTFVTGEILFVDGGEHVL
ncbi:SDR family oxidoreductase [bacterium]|nr:SDR family oxidoreductase [bacterium]